MADIWIITDGKKGTENQCISLAESLDQKYKLIKINPLFGINHLPSFFWTIPMGKIPMILLYGSTNILSFNWPRIIIASGKASVGISIILKKIIKNKILVVQIQDPRVNSKYFDVVSSPLHDNTPGKNVIRTFGALNRVNSKTISIAKKNFENKFNFFEKPIIAVLVGGDNKHFRMAQQDMINLILNLNKIQKKMNVTILTTFSRRTNPKIKNLFKLKLNNYKNITSESEEKNPYMAYLAYSDYFIITEDSVSMVSEAASTGKPIYIYKLKGKSKKFENFYKQLYIKNIIRDFEGDIEKPWVYEKLNDTVNVANILKEKYSSFLND